MTKEQAIAELKNYPDKSLYSINLERVEMIIAMGVEDINKSENATIMNGFLVNYKKIIDAIETDEQIRLRKLSEAKSKATIELNSYDDISRYNLTEQGLLRGYIDNGLLAIENALDIETIETELSHWIDLIVGLKQKEYKDKRMYLNNSTYDFIDIKDGADPDLYPGESDYRLIQLYNNHFAGLTYPGISTPRPSLKLFTMSKEEAE